MIENKAIEIFRNANKLCLLKCKGKCGLRENNVCNCADAIIERLLNELLQYRENGAVEECREAREKQTQKKCAIDSCPDHTHYKCPSCGQIELSIYKHGFPRLGRITKYCENCGQALIDEN